MHMTESRLGPITETRVEVIQAKRRTKHTQPDEGQCQHSQTKVAATSAERRSHPTDGAPNWNNRQIARGSSGARKAIEKPGRSSRSALVIEHTEAHRAYRNSSPKLKRTQPTVTDNHTERKRPRKHRIDQGNIT